MIRATQQYPTVNCLELSTTQDLSHRSWWFNPEMKWTCVQIRILESLPLKSPTFLMLVHSTLSLATPYPLTLNKSLRWICSMETQESFQIPKLVKSLQYYVLYTFMNVKISHMAQFISLSILIKQKLLYYTLLYNLEILLHILIFNSQSNPVKE